MHQGAARTKVRHEVGAKSSMDEQESRRCDRSEYKHVQQVCRLVQPSEKACAHVIKAGAEAVRRAEVLQVIRDCEAAV